MSLKHILIFIVFVSSIIGLNSSLPSSIMGELKSNAMLENNSNTTTSLFPQVINITKNTNATDHIVEYSIKIFNDTLMNTQTKNTNVTGPAAEYIVKTFKDTIEVAKNTNATRTAAEHIFKIINNTMNSQPSIEGKLAIEKIPVLIEALKNTNATSIAIQYVISVTNSTTAK